MGSRVLAVFAVATAIGCGVTAVASADPTTTPPSPAEANASAAAPGDGHGAPGSTPQAPEPAATGPVTLLDHDGTFTVGKDVVPGVYSSAGPLAGDSCYWRRIGADNKTVENALTKQPQVVQIDAGDLAFKTNGCQPWQLTNAAAPPNQNPPWLSQLQLRHNLDILNGLAGQSGNGQLPSY